MIVLATGTAVEDPDDPDGLCEIQLKGNPDLGTDLPIEDDENEEAKIWLGLSDDIETNGNGDSYMSGWHPTGYLFEYDLITYADTDKDD